MRLPADALTKRANVDVLVGRDEGDGHSKLLLRLTDLDSGTITWLPMPIGPARQLAYKILMQSEAAEAADPG